MDAAQRRKEMLKATLQCARTTLESAQTTVAILEARVAELEEQENRWATPKNNPFGSPTVFKRLANEGAFPTRRGPRNRLEARWSDCEKYVRTTLTTPGAQAPQNDTPDGTADAIDEALADGALIRRSA